MSDQEFLESTVLIAPFVCRGEVTRVNEMDDFVEVIGDDFTPGNRHGVVAWKQLGQMSEEDAIQQADQLQRSFSRLVQFYSDRYTRAENNHLKTYHVIVYLPGPDACIYNTADASNPSYMFDDMECSSWELKQLGIEFDSVKTESTNFDKYIDAILIKESRGKSTSVPMTPQRKYVKQYRHPANERIHIKGQKR